MKPFSPALPLVLLPALIGCPENVTPPPRAGYSGTPPVLECMTNLDGRLDSHELAAAFGVTVSYLVSPDGVERDVDTVGRVADDGSRRWDLGEDRADDQVLTIIPTELTDQWYAERFPEGDFVLPLDAGGTQFGVYTQNEDAVWLLGSASAEESPAEGQTLLVYDKPVAVLRFPLEPGASWTSSASIVNGMLFGLPFAGTHTYEVTADAQGELTLPQLIFGQAHRVKTRFTVDPVVGPETFVRQTSFFFECFGEVARATSRPGEPDEDFDIAAEVRRLGQGLVEE